MNHQTCSIEGVERLTDELEKTRRLYHELLFAVSQKFPGETRHDTALKYIQERENASLRCAGKNTPDTAT